MVGTCFHIRSILAAMVGNHASEADWLRVEEHLAACESCRQEEARWRLMETLREQTPAALTSSARDRVLSAIIHMPKPRGVELSPRRALPRFGIAMAAVTCAVALGIGLWVAKPFHPPVAKTTAGDAVLAPTSVPLPGKPSAVAKDVMMAENAGAVSYGGATIRYQSGASFRMRPNLRDVELLKGELDVEVIPGLPGRFRVLTARFSVEVLGTHFVVGQTRVQTMHGKVRVLDAAGKQLALLTAGQSWEPDRTPEPSVQPTPVASPVRTRSHATPRAAAQSVDQLLAEARAVLGAGNPAQARARIELALDADPTRRQRAIAELLAADSLLVESKYPAALAGYRRTLALFDGYPEAETAAYTLAQLLSERGAPEEARRALSHYLDRYPHGRFNQEATRKLASLSRP